MATFGDYQDALIQLEKAAGAYYANHKWGDIQAAPTGTATSGFAQWIPVSPQPEITYRPYYNTPYTVDAVNKINPQDLERLKDLMARSIIEQNRRLQSGFTLTKEEAERRYVSDLFLSDWE